MLTAPFLVNSDLKRINFSTTPLPNLDSLCSETRPSRLVCCLKREIVICGSNGRSSDSETNLIPEARSLILEDLTPIQSIRAFDGF